MALYAYMLMFSAYECEVYYDFTRRKIELYHILRGKVGVVKRGKILHTGLYFLHKITLDNLSLYILINQCIKVFYILF